LARPLRAIDLELERLGGACVLRDRLAGDLVAAVVFGDLRAACNERLSRRVAEVEVHDAGTARRQMSIDAGGQVTDADNVTAGV
jgi:hypothetical protein